MTQLDCYLQLLADSSATVAATLPPGRARALLALSRAEDTVAPVPTDQSALVGVSDGCGFRFGMMSGSAGNKRAKSLLFKVIKADAVWSAWTPMIKSARMRRGNAPSEARRRSAYA